MLTPVVRRVRVAAVAGITTIGPAAGGDAAIAASVNTTLNAAGFNVVRLAGTDRFGTSVAVAQCEGSPTSRDPSIGRQLRLI